MPLQHIQPELAFTVTDTQGTEWDIYHVYKNNNFDGGRETFWYTTDIDEQEEYEFDIRNIIRIPGIEETLTPLQRYGGAVLESDGHHLMLQLALSTGGASFKHQKVVVTGGAACLAQG